MDCLAYIREEYNVPAEKGGRILFLYKNKKGTIIGGKNGKLKVKFDDEKTPVFLHPTWEIKYIEKAGE